MPGRPGSGRAGYSQRPSLAASSTRHEGPAVFPPQTLATGRRAGRQLLTFASLLLVSPRSAFLCSALPGTVLLFLLCSALLFLRLLCFALPQTACFLLLYISWHCFAFPCATSLCFALLCTALPFLGTLYFAFPGTACHFFSLYSILFPSRA